VTSLFTSGTIRILVCNRKGKKCLQYPIFRIMIRKWRLYQYVSPAGRRAIDDWRKSLPIGPPRADMDTFLRDMVKRDLWEPGFRTSSRNTARFDGTTMEIRKAASQNFRLPARGPRISHADRLHSQRNLRSSGSAGDGVGAKTTDSRPRGID